MSAPVNGYFGSGQALTPNGGAVPPRLKGPVAPYAGVTGYPTTCYYERPPRQSHPAIPSHKSPIANNYYDNQCQIAPWSSAPPPRTQAGAVAPSSAPPPGTPYAQFQQEQRHPPYANAGSYYGPSFYRPPAAPCHQQQPTLLPAPPSGPECPLYPVVSYPSPAGTSQYGTLVSSQTAALPGTAVPGVHSGYTLAPPTHHQGNTVENPTHHGSAPPTSPPYNYYGSGGVNGERAPSGTHAHSSPGHRQGKRYGSAANNSAPGPDAGPSSSSSEEEDEDDDDDEEEEEDEEAGGDTSSSTTGSASPLPNSYDSLEGGHFPEAMRPATHASERAPPRGYPGSPADPPSGDALGPAGCQPYSQPFPSLSQLSAALGGLSGVPELEVEALRPLDLLQERNLLPPRPLAPPEPNLSQELKKVNCSPQTFRCTLTSVPQTQALLNKARLPLGLLLHPFRDLQQLPVITSNTIVRCRHCRTYINPFVTFLDQRRWKCNLCYRVNDVPDEFMYNPVTRSYGEPHKRPEVQNATVEFIASSDYMLRPPQPAVYLFVLDVSHNAVESGYLKYFCQSLLDNLDKLPGDSRTKVGFLTFDSHVHFYNLQEGLSRPQMLVVTDIDDIFIPSHDSLMVSWRDSKELIKDLLASLPSTFNRSSETQSALGPALQAAFKLMSPSGGRVSVFQTQRPTLGAGSLQCREDPERHSDAKGVQHLGPATDFYKKLALDCSGQQIAVDLFLLSSQYADLASLACISKYSAGSIFYYPNFHGVRNPAQVEKFQKDLERYFARKLGFEAVMRIRCTKGLSIHTFHGNFFVRSTDLLSLANVNPDSSFAVQMSIDDSLADSSLACFQAALLYTSSKGKRRIRVHTLCLPVVSQLSDVYAGADVHAITCLLANMAIDRSILSSLSDARDALINAAVDFVSAYRRSASNPQHSGPLVPASMRLFLLYVLALLKQKAFCTETNTRLDERVYAMCEFKTQPLQQLMRMIHPELYRLDDMSDQGALHLDDTLVPQPPLLHLSAERLSMNGAFLMDCGNVFYLWIGKHCNEMFIRDVLDYPNFASIPSNMGCIPELPTLLSERVRAFLDWLQDNRAFRSILHVIKDEASSNGVFFQHLVEDRSEAGSSYQDFLRHIQQQVS
ncbi:protein transport protein Sec24B [Stigmatopora nigra]